MRDLQQRPAVVFRFPMPLNISNARLHWRTKERERNKYFATLDTMQAIGQLPPPPPTPMPHATISAVMYLGAAMDDGNAMHRCEKWPCDWLKTRGYIVDDRRSCLTWKGLPEQIVKRDGNYRCEITLTETAR